MTLRPSRGTSGDPLPSTSPPFSLPSLPTVIPSTLPSPPLPPLCSIERYSVIPLSPNSGLIGWVPHCDTIHSLIRDYREKKKIMLNIEHRLMLQVRGAGEKLSGGQWRNFQGAGRNFQGGSGETFRGAVEKLSGGQWRNFQGGAGE